MKKSLKCLLEVVERAISILRASEGQHDSQWTAIVSIGGKIACRAETLCKWVPQAVHNTGYRLGVTGAEKVRI